MPRIPTLSTDRLVLRPPAPGDAADLVALGADAQVMRYIGSGQPQTPTQAIVWLEWMLADGRHGHANPESPEGLPGWLIVIEQRTCAFVGLAVLQMLPATQVAAIGVELCTPPCVEVGYRLAQAHWNRGYATEAAGALIRYAFDVLALPQVVAIADIRNAPSNRVLDKLGLATQKTYEFNGQTIHFRARRGGN